MSVQYSRTVQRPEFVTLTAIYQFITAGILLLLSCLVPAVVLPSIIFFIDPAEGAISGAIMATGILALLLGFAFASLVVGWGLLRMREWARMGAIVLAAFALIGFPIWTIVAVLILVYLTSDEARYAFNPNLAPPEITKTTVSTGGPDRPTEAAYKTEPPESYTPPTEQTRRVRYTAPGAITAEPPSGTAAPADAFSADETLAMPIPPQDPSAATESLYDEEADVSDHYRRWKASLEQEQSAPAETPDDSEAPPVTSEMDAPAPEDSPDEDDQNATVRVVGPAESSPEEPEAEPSAGSEPASEREESDDTEEDEGSDKRQGT